MKLLKDFREFALRGNIMDMAVGIILGAAFGTLVKSLVDDILMPPIGLLLGGVDFSNIFLTVKEGAVPGPYISLAAARQAGAVTINFGVFLNTVISFTIVAFAVFGVVRSVNKLRNVLEGEKKDTQKECPFCRSAINIDASRCPQCTSHLDTSTQTAQGAKPVI